MPFRPNDTLSDARTAGAAARDSTHGGPDVILRRYAAHAPLSAANVALLHGLRGAHISVAAGQDIESEEMAARAPRLIASGWACRFRMLSDGRRMILGFVLPGDALSLRAHLPSPPLVSATALTDCRLVDATPLWKAVTSLDHTHASLARAQQAIDLQEAALLLDHIVRLGRQTALERICHLLLELRWRLHQVGLARMREFPMPLTQETLADAVGLSIVHVNRTLQRLRRERMIECRRGCVALLQPERMAAIAEFEPPNGAPLLHAARSTAD
jgi:CRP-like cAMP-binding protein